MWDWVWRNLPTAQGRIAAGLLLTSSIVVGLWPDHGREFDPAKAAAIAAAAITWLIAEFSGVGNPSAHDIALYNRIREILDDDALSFLRDHDFHIDLHDRFTRPVHSIAEWHGADYDFVDGRLQRKWARVRGRVATLSERYGVTLVSTNRPGILTAHLIGVERHMEPPHVKVEITTLNEASFALYRDFNAFSRLAKIRLRL